MTKLARPNRKSARGSVYLPRLGVTLADPLALSLRMIMKRKIKRSPI
jgi:hypothetical protein